jgi:DNA repair exonuclease SbcCD ATPase subunit
VQNPIITCNLTTNDTFFSAAAAPTDHQSRHIAMLRSLNPTPPTLLVGALATKLRKEFIKLLEKDPEFRQTVAGYLGLAETLKKLDQHLEELRSIRQEQQKTWQNIEKLWQEVRELRQDQTKLWEEVKGLRENQERLWQEVRELRVNQTKLWEEVKGLRENQEKLWEEVRELRVNQSKLWENTEKLWEEVKALRENQEKLWQEVRELRHDFIVFRTELTGISATVGAIAESGARRALREWAAAQGIRLGKLRPITVEGREINFVAEYVDTEGRKGILYAEAKSTVRSREVEDFSQLASAAEKIYGQGLKVILGFRIYEEAYEAAGKEGITLVEA